MENLNNLKELWKSCTQHGSAAQRLSEESLKGILNIHIKKERQLLIHYVIKTGIWIFLVTAAFAHLLIRFWGDRPIMVLSLAALLLYIPFTVIFMQRFKSFFGLEAKVNSEEVLSVFQRLKKRQEDIKRFYQFKKLFDTCMIPISCLVITLAINAYTFATGLAVHWQFNGLVLLIALILFIVATFQDNQRYFKGPLAKIDQVLQDMET